MKDNSCKSKKREKMFYISLIGNSVMLVPFKSELVSKYRFVCVSFIDDVWCSYDCMLYKIHMY